MTAKTVAKAVLINPEGNILVLRRSLTDEHSPGRFDFPGGGVEPGEDYKTAVVREIKEESGLDVLPHTLDLAYAQTSEPNTEDQIITRLLFIGHVASTEVALNPAEHDEFWWKKSEELSETFRQSSWTPGVDFIIAHNLLVAHSEAA